ncbi:hypothetical protein ACSFA2_22130 [Variovorax sp. LT2P21]|uniref:hypothetical protein n=1 Tax=Variovorax sp. LT2P21 TaxID=3443731 RepID=UPI003F46D41F
MTPFHRSLRLAALTLGLLGLLAHAQPPPSAARWEPLEGIQFGRDVRGIHVDRGGLTEVENLNTDDDRAYPAVLVLVDLANERSAGILGSYRSLAYLVAIDCAGRRAQNVQTRFYAQHGGVERSAIMGTLSMWKWDPAQSTDPQMARPLLARYCGAR